MTRETKYNLIFLVVIVALLSPGGVILFKRKLEPTAKPMYLPDPVPHAIAYVSPQEVPPGMARVAPRHVSAWLDALVADHVPAGALRPRDEDGLPLMSRERRYQVVAVEPARMDGSAGSGAWVLYWGGIDKLASRWTREAGGATEDGTVQRSMTIALPRIVREDLGESGMVMPPKEVVLQKIDFPGTRPLPWHLSATWEKGTKDSADIVQTFTSPVASKN